MRDLTSLLEERDQALTELRKFEFSQRAGKRLFALYQDSDIVPKPLPEECFHIEAPKKIIDLKQYLKVVEKSLYKIEDTVLKYNDNSLIQRIKLEIDSLPETDPEVINEEETVIEID